MITKYRLLYLVSIIVKIERSKLYLHHINRGLALKNIDKQNQSLMINRLANLICNEPKTYETIYIYIYYKSLNKWTNS